MHKIKKLKLGMENGDYIASSIEKDLGIILPDSFNEFMQLYASPSLYECIYSSENSLFEVEQFIETHWIRVRSKGLSNIGRGKRVAFALSPEHKYYCISFDEETYGNVILLENMKQDIINGVFVRLKEVQLPFGHPVETIVAEDFNEFVLGLKKKEGEDIKDALHYCKDNQRVKYKNLKEFNIRPKIQDSEFKELEEMLDAKLPVYFKEFMKRYAGVIIMENGYYLGDELHEFNGFNNFDEIKNWLTTVMEDPLMEKMLPFAASYGYYSICISLNEKNYGEVVFYDSRYGDYEESYYNVITDSFEDFVNSIFIPPDRKRREYLYYCDEDLVY